MIRKLALILSLIGILTWGGYALFSVLSLPNQQSYLNHFSSEDGFVIVIHHPEDFNSHQLEININQENLALFNSIKAKLSGLKSAYLSQKRKLLVITLDEKWSQKKISEVFSKGISTFETTGNNTFRFGKYRGTFHSNELQLAYYDLKFTEKTQPTWKTDCQASYSLVDLSKNPAIIQDIYIKKNQKIAYAYRPSTFTKCPLVDDLKMFSCFVPKDADFYEFYEKQFLLNSDNVFKNSPISQAMQTGGIVVYYQKTPLFIFELKDDLDLTAYLNDFFKVPEDNKPQKRYSNLKVSSEFSASCSGIGDSSLVVYSKDGFGFITPEEGALNGLLLELDVQNTDSSKLIREFLTTDLPQRVSHRKIIPGISQGSCSLQGQILAITITKTSNKRISKEEEITNYFSINSGSPVVSYCASSGRGNVLVETEDELVGIKNGRVKWRQKHDTPLELKPQLIYNRNIENEYFLLTYPDRCEVIDKMGKNLYKINKTSSLNALQMVFKTQPVFLLKHSDEICMYSSDNGKVIKRFNFKETVSSWGIIAEGNSSSAILTSGNQLYSLNLMTGKKIKMNNPSTNLIGFYRKGMVLRGTKGMQLFEKGRLSDVQIPSYWKFIGETQLNQQVALLFYDGKTLALTLNGKVQWKINPLVAEITEVQVLHQMIAVRDGLENKLKLYNTSGKEIDAENRPSENSIQITPFGDNGYSLTTGKSDFLIQYNIVP